MITQRSSSRFLNFFFQKFSRPIYSMLIFSCQKNIYLPSYLVCFQFFERSLVNTLNSTFLHVVRNSAILFRNMVWLIFVFILVVEINQVFPPKVCVVKPTCCPCAFCILPVWSLGPLATGFSCLLTRSGSVNFIRGFLEAETPRRI